MIASLVVCTLFANLSDPPKQPVFGINKMQRVIELLRADEVKIRPEYYRDMSRWIRLYGVDVPEAGQPGYSGARQDLEIILGREADVYVQDDKEDHTVTRNGMWVEYMWTRGKLIEYELVHDGWAKVNDEGRKGRYSKVLIAAEDEAKRFHEGIWAQH